MTDHPGFLRAILAEPDDDTHRLVYSDWLEENGQEERAEFIRAQVAAAATGHVDCPQKVAGERCGVCDFCRPMASAEEIFNGPAGRWLIGELSFSYAYDCNHWTLHADFMREHPSLYLWRGFVHTVRCPLAAWEEHGPALVSRHPVERVEATDWEPRECAGHHPLAWALNAAYAPVWAGGEEPWWHPTREAACAEMSRRLLAWACRFAWANGLYPCSNQDTDIQK